MAFVRAKRQGDRSYYQLVENRREGGRVRQRVLAHLGHYPSLEAAIEGYSAAAARACGYEHRARQRALAVVPVSVRDQPGLVIPRPEGRRRGWHRKYWHWTDFADQQARRTNHLLAQVNKLEVCSAQEAPAVGRLLGTTRERSDQQFHASATKLGTTKGLCPRDTGGG